MYHILEDKYTINFVDKKTTIEDKKLDRADILIMQDEDSDNSFLLDANNLEEIFQYMAQKIFIDKKYNEDFCVEIDLFLYNLAVAERITYDLIDFDSDEFDEDNIENILFKFLSPEEYAIFFQIFGELEQANFNKKESFILRASLTYYTLMYISANCALKNNINTRVLDEILFEYSKISKKEDSYNTHFLYNIHF